MIIMILRTCIKCGAEAKTEEELKLFITQKTSKYGRKQLCKKCFSITRKKGTTKEERAEYARTWRWEKKMQFIEMLGGGCVKCGEDHPYVLQFHHINGREKDHVKYWFQRVREFIKLIRRGEIMLLCANCHIKEHIKYD